MVTGRKSLRSRGNSMCKGPEAAAVPEHVRSNKEWCGWSPVSEGPVAGR